MLPSIKSNKFAELKLLTNSVLKTVECTICLDTLSDPVSVGCGHFFCRNCITCLLKTKFRAPCPLCSKSFTKRCVQEASQRQLIVKSVIDLVSAVKNLVEPEDSEEKKHTTAGKLDILGKNVELNEVISDCQSSRKRKSDEQDPWKKDSFANFEISEAENLTLQDNKTSNKKTNSKVNDASLERKKRKKSLPVLNQTKDGSSDIIVHRSDEIFNSKSSHNKIEEATSRISESEKCVNLKSTSSLQNVNMEETNHPNVPIVIESFKVTVQNADMNESSEQGSSCIASALKTVVGKNLFADEKKKGKEKVEFGKFQRSDAESYNPHKKKFFKINKSKIRKLLAASKANMKPLIPENDIDENGCADPLPHRNINSEAETIHEENEALCEIPEKAAHYEHLPLMVESHVENSVVDESRLLISGRCVDSLERDKSSAAVDPFKQNENHSTYVNECMGMEVNLCTENESENNSQSADLVIAKSYVCTENNHKNNPDNLVTESSQDDNNPIKEDFIVEEILENKRGDSSFSKSPGWSRLKQMNKDFHPKTFPLLDIIHKNKLLTNSTTLNAVEHCANVSLEVVPSSSTELTIFSSQKSMDIPPSDTNRDVHVENVEESPIHCDTSHNTMDFEKISKNKICGEDDLFNEGPVEESNNRVLSISGTENCSSQNQRDLIDASVISDETIISKQHFQVEKLAEFSGCSNAKSAEKLKTNTFTEIKTPKFTRLSRNKNSFNKTSISGVEIHENDTCSNYVALSNQHKGTSRNNLEERLTTSVPTSVKSVLSMEKYRISESEYSKTLSSKEPEIINDRHDVSTKKMTLNENNSEDVSTALQGSTAPFMPNTNECIVDVMDHGIYDNLVSNNFVEEDTAKKGNMDSPSIKDQTAHKKTSKPLKKRKRKFTLKPTKHAKTITNGTNDSNNVETIISNLIEYKPKCLTKNQEDNISTVAMKCSGAEYVRENMYSVEKSASADNPCSEKILPIEKTKVIKRICLTLEEIESYFKKSSNSGKCEVATVPLPFSDFKLELNVSDETLNVSVLRVIKSQTSESSGKAIADDKSNNSLKQRNEVQTQFPETSENVNKIIMTDDTVFSNSFHRMTKDLPGSAEKKMNIETISRSDASVNKFPGQITVQSNNEVTTNGISQSFVECSVGRELYNMPNISIMNMNATNRKIESCSLQSEDVEIFKDFSESESQIPNTKSDFFEKDVCNSLLESKEIKNMSKSKKAVQECTDDHLITSSVRKNDEVIADCLLPISEKPCVKNTNIECLDSQDSENSLDTHIWPTLSDCCSKPTDECEENCVINESMGSSTEKNPYPTTTSNYHDDITRNVKSPVFNDELKTKHSSQMDVKEKFVPDSPDIELSEDIDPFGDTGEFYKKLTSQGHGRMNFEEIIKETESYASDPDMQFANDLVGPLKDIAREMISKAEVDSNIGNNHLTFSKNKNLGKSATIQTETVSPSQRQRSCSTNDVKKKMKRFRRIAQVDSSDDEMPTQPYPINYATEESCQVGANGSSEKTSSRYCEKNKSLADFDSLDDVENENGMDASLQCLTLDSDIPSSVADKMKREIEMMNEKLGKLKRAINENNDDSCSISSDDELTQFHNLESSTHSENVQVHESDENSDLDLFTEQIPPTPPKYDGNPIN